MEIGYSIKVLTSARQLEKDILRAIAEAINEQLFKNKSIVQSNIRQLVENAFKSQPEYKSLQGGKLQSELGVVNAKNKIDVIIERWVDSIVLQINSIKVFGQNFRGKIVLDLMPTNFADVLNLPEASYITNKGVKIEWLRWLLFEGDKFIIRDYMLGVDRRKIARTGLGQIMIKRGKLNVGWQVPPEFSGTARNNFATRALLSVQDELEKEINGLFK